MLMDSTNIPVLNRFLHARKTVLRQKLTRIGFAVVVAGVAVGSPTSASDQPTITNDQVESASQVQFDRHIQPILSEKCLACHGFDSGTLEGGLRLDLRDAALAGGDSGLPAIVPGQPENSQMIRRVTADDDELMPPAHANLPRLTDQEVELLRQWILSGANYTAHWAFVPPSKSAAAGLVSPDTNAASAIDALVANKLRSLGKAASPPADPWQLCRRLYLDLIGLPPTPEELLEFEKQGFSTTVEKLLASQRFGEKWARPWMDATRYSDTNGYEKDLQREQWVWRDWVIQAFNDDMPYDQFVIQQIAGDLLPSSSKQHSQQQLIATGMLRNSMINEEGAIIPEEFRMVEMFDRIDCVGKAVLGLSTQCAQCHSHKFDPMTHEEYFGMFAFLNNTYEAQSWIYSDDQLAKIDEIHLAVAGIEEQIQKDRTDWQTAMDLWADEVRQSQAEWQPVRFDDMNSISGLNHPTQQPDHSLLMLGHRSDDVYFIGQPDLNGATGMRLEILCHGDLPFLGPGRNSLGGWNVREVEVFIQPAGSGDWQKLKLMNATADFSEPESTYEEGKKRRGPVAFLIDGADDTAWQADRGPGRRNSPSVAVFQFDQPIAAVEGTRLKVAMRMSDMVGCCRFSLTKSPNPTTPAVDYTAQLAIIHDGINRDSLDHASQFNAALFHNSQFAAWIRSVSELKSYTDQIEDWYGQFPQAKTSVLHLRERPASDRRATHFLSRGDWMRPQQEILPLVPSAWHPLPSGGQSGDQEPLRLRFARWLVDRQSPFAARVAVNRIWQSIFGIGLVETSEDFGTRTPVPEYREILDWLAVDMMEHQWSTKHILRQIVSSRTYQQSSRADSSMLAEDPDNRLLQRGPRFRVDAEVVRDSVLAIAGLIHHEMGGPSVIPPVPQNVLDYNYTYPSYWKPAMGKDRYRRAVYNFRKRSMPDPAMSSLDAPNADFACARRIRSNTPLAALTGLNEPIFVESAQGLALRVLRQAPADDRQRLNLAFQLCMARYPTQEEQAVMLQLISVQRQRIADGWLNPREISTGLSDKLPELPTGATPQDAAVWTLAARVLLNLDETLCKN